LNRLLHSESGVALILTVSIVAVLLAAGLQLSRYVGDRAMITGRDKDRFEARELAFSGIELARLVLADDAAKNTTDSVQEIWADPEKLESLMEQAGMKNDQIKLKITDELSKIQVNALLSEFPGNRINPDLARILHNFLMLRFSGDINAGQEKATGIVNSLKDWLDSKDDQAVTGLSGAESEYYLGLERPYKCADGPLNHISELVSVKGLAKDLLVSPEFDETEPGNEREKSEPGDVFTVFGLADRATGKGGYRYTGKININTAGVDVLKALLPEGMDYLAEDLVTYRGRKGEEDQEFIHHLKKGWYQNVIQLSAEEMQRFRRTITYSSHIYKVECTAAVNRTDITLTAFMKREKYNKSGKWVSRMIRLEE